MFKRVNGISPFKNTASSDVRKAQKSGILITLSSEIETVQN